MQKNAKQNDLPFGYKHCDYVECQQSFKARTARQHYCSEECRKAATLHYRTRAAITIDEVEYFDAEKYQKTVFGL